MSVDLELDKPRALKFDLRAIKDLERSYGKPLGQIVIDLSQMSVTAITDCLCYGLRHEDRAMTSNLATKILEDYLAAGHTIDTVAVAINDAVMASGLFKRPGDEDTEGNRTRTAAAS